MKVLVSVIIPTYKRPALLLKCLENLGKQEFSPGHYEVIVVTDGPDEITASIVRERFQKKPVYHITCVSLPKKAGPAAARNAGWKMAAGDLILFTDDDCLPGKDWVQQFYQAYQSYQKESIAFTGRIIVPLIGTPTDFEKNTSHLETADFVTANCACTRVALEKAGGFDETFTMAWREDSDLEFRLLKQDIPIHKIPQAVVVHPARKAPWGVSLKEQKKSMFDALLYRKHPRLFKHKIPRHIIWTYFFTVFFLLAGILLYFLKIFPAAFLFFAAWLFLWGHFVLKRLKGTRKSPNHVAEMMLTSLLIPFISLYWNAYGYVKFKAATNEERLT